MAEAVADALVGEVVWDAAGWQRLRGHAAGRRAALARQVQTQVADGAARRGGRAGEMERRGGDALRETRLDVARQLGRLLHPGLGRRPPGVGRLADVERYLRAAERRLERAPDALAADRDHMRHAARARAAAPTAGCSRSCASATSLRRWPDRVSRPSASARSAR